MHRGWKYVGRAMKYGLAILMMILGIITGVSPTPAVGGPLDFLFSSPWFVAAFGVYIVIGGLMLFYGEYKDKDKWRGRGFLTIFNCFLFATIISFVQFGADPVNWIGNFVFALVTGYAYIHWQLKHLYIKVSKLDETLSEVSDELIDKDK